MRQSCHIEISIKVTAGKKTVDEAVPTQRQAVELSQARSPLAV